MAISAAIVLTPSSLSSTAGVQSSAALTVTNSGTSAVNVTGVVPFAEPHGGTTGSVSVLVGQPNIGPGMPTSVPGSSGTLVITFPVVANAPQVANYKNNPFPSAGQGGAAITPLPPIAMPQSQSYDIGATVYTSDGSVTAATTAQLTVTAGPQY